MTSADIAFWQLCAARAATYTPDIAAAILRAFGILRETLAGAPLERMIATGDVDAIFQDVLTEPAFAVAFRKLREQLQTTTARQVRYFVRDLPFGGRVDGTIAVGFDVLNPKVIDAVRSLDTKVMTTLTSDVRETTRAVVEAGLRDGVGPRAIARELRDVIGLAPNQEQAIRNFRALLERGDREALKRALRDRRFDKTFQKALGPNGKGLSEAQVDKMVDAYRKRMIAFNAETNARTASLQAMKTGQHLSWQEAVDKGIVDGARLKKTWVGVMDDRERPEHMAMEGATVPWDQAYSNGNMIPGDDTFNCRCVSRYGQAMR